MAYRKTHDLAVVVHTTEKDGKKKNRYKNVGAILSNDEGGSMMLLDRTFNPAGCPVDGRDSILISRFEVKTDNPTPTQATTQQVIDPADIQWEN